MKVTVSGTYPLSKWDKPLSSPHPAPKPVSKKKGRPSKEEA
jgi:hypothetical protein